MLFLGGRTLGTYLPRLLRRLSNPMPGAMKLGASPEREMGPTTGQSGRLVSYNRRAGTTDGRDGPDSKSWVMRLEKE